MEREHEGVKLFTDREKQTFDIITKVYRQQHNHFRSGDARESIPDRIVSIAKPYVRPIVRCAQVMASRPPLSRKASARRRNERKTL